MSLQKIIVTVILVFVFWFFILNSTFSTDFQTKNPQLKDYVWFSEMVQSWNTLALKNIEENQIWINKLWVDNLNFIDKVYFYWTQKWFYSKKVSWNQTKLNLWKGLYLLNLYDLSNNYVVSYSWFSLKPNSPWKIFIDTTDANSIKIFSIDSVFYLDLLDPATKTKMSQIMLFPRLSISFNPERNKFVKNADLLRLETIYNTTYISSKILDNEKKINLDFVSKIYSSDNSQVKDFITKSFSYFYDDYFNIQKLNIKIQSNLLTWIEYIDKYYSFFLNDSKKSIYYQSLIVKNLNLYLEKPDSDLKNKILSDLDTLKTLNQDNYFEFKKIIEYYYKIWIYSENFDSVESVYLLSEMLNKYKNNDFSSIKKSSFYLNKLYNLIDLNDVWYNDIKDKIILYLDSYFKENNVIYNSKKYEISTNNDKIFNELQNLSFFIKNIILNTTDLSQKNDFNDLLEIYWRYYSINSQLILMSSNELSENILIQHSIILDKLLSIVKDNYFAKDLDKKGFLLLNPYITPSSDSLFKLNSIYKKIYQLYFTKNIQLTEKNKIYNSLYDRLDNIFSKYYLALSNYDDYLVKYDQTKGELLTTNTVYVQQQSIIDENNKLSIDKLKNYLWYFDWIDINNISLNIVNNNFYSIKQLNINWENFSFDLYPNSKNRIQNIVKGWQKLKDSYDLDTLKEYYEKSTWWENDDKFNFKKFFINTFINNTNNQSPNIYKEEVEVKEDRIISVFKRDKLFSSIWDFTILKSIFSVEYNDVSVINQNNSYNIKINNSKLQIPSNVNWEDSNIVANLSSDYIFSQNEHYFKNIYLKFVDSQSTDAQNIVYLLWWNQVFLNFNVNTLEFNKKMPIILNDIFASNIVYTQIETVTWLNNVKIEYKQDWTIIYSFNYKQKSTIVTLKNSKIISLNFGWRNVLNNMLINYSDLSQYLYMLK